MEFSEKRPNDDPQDFHRDTSENQFSVTQPYQDLVEIPESEAMLLSAARSMDEGIAIIDAAGCLIQVNEAFGEIINRRDNLPGKHLQDVLPNNERFKLDLNLKRICKGERLSMELTMRGQGYHDRVLLLSSGPCQTRKGEPVFFLVLSDITDIRQAESEKLYLMEQILSNRHVDRMSTFAGGISHEFNNILQVIRANAEACPLELQARHPSASKLDEIVSSTYRAERMIKQLLTFSRSQNEERREFNLSSVIRRVLSLGTLRKELPADCGLELLTQNDLVFADELQIEQVIRQLLANATQSLPTEDGRIRIRVQDAREEMLERLPSTGGSADNYLLIEVEDNGNGIPGEYIDRIFDPFFTTRCVGKGTGMGLAVAQGIVSSHNGVIWAVPVQRGGTCIRVLLRRVRSTPSVIRNQKEMPVQRVLLVDDEDVIVRLGKRMLARAGVEVIATTDAQEASQLLAEDAKSFSMLITDQNMPDCNGDRKSVV